MGNVRIEPEKLGSVTPDETRKGNFRPICEHINVHMIFEIRMERKFNRK